MSDCVIRARGLHMRYGDGPTAVPALRGVSLDVRAGEILMISGPSGSGKTTLLQLFGALKQPTAGQLSLYDVRIDGLSVEELRRIRIETIGFVFQSYNLFPTLKAWENVAIPLDLLGWEPSRRRGARPPAARRPRHGAARRLHAGEAQRRSAPTGRHRPRARP